MFLEERKFSPHVNVWAAMGRNEAFGPYIFKKMIQLLSSTLINTYLKDISIPQLRRRNWIVKNTYFQHDNATPHTAKKNCDFSREKIKIEHVISKPLWPPRSPDLTPLDFNTFGYLKSKVYANDPRTFQDLKRNISNEIRAITNTVTQNVFSSLKHRIELCRQVQGGHIQQLL